MDESDPILPHIDICICTFRRPVLLRRLLDRLLDLKVEGRFTSSIVVGDNDAAESAREVVAAFVAVSPMPTIYCTEPVQNIALMRNHVLAFGEGEFVALIDDDEWPSEEWLLRLLTTCQSEQAEGVLGPVLPEFPPATPDWFRRAGLYSFRKRYRTGQKLSWHECRTGNALLRRQCLKEISGPFREEFGTGGEDQDFFRRAMDREKVFVWCDEAVVYETIQHSRWNRRVMLSRALLRGKNTFRHGGHRGRNLAKALLAIPFYSLALPVAIVAGQHHFMKLLVKLASHAGLLLALIGLNPINRRRM